MPRITNTHKASKLTALLSLLTVFAFAKTPDVATPMASRRAMLALAREEKADAGPVKDVMIGSILLVVSYVVALTLYPILTSQVKTAQSNANSTSTNNTLLGLLPTIFIIVLVVAGVGFLFKGLKGFYEQSQ